MSKKKLFFDGTPLIGKYVSGVGKVLQETLYALDIPEYANLYDMSIFLPIDEKGKLDGFQFKYIKVKYLPYPHKFLSLFSRMRLSPPIDIFLGKGVYVFENFRNWNLLFSKSITYIHDVAFKVFPEFVEERNLNYLNKNINKWKHRADVVVTVSEASAADIKKKLGIDAKVIANAANGALFYPRSRDEIKKVTSRWDIEGEYYIFIGNIEPRKNLENTIDAFRGAIKSDEQLVLIGGGGWKNEEILEKIKETEKGVVYRPDGYVPDEDLPALISGARALVHFPWYEGSGLPILQALACGTPVAASNIAPLIEVVEGSEDRVVFSDPGNITEMTQAIIEASKKPHGEAPQRNVSWQDAAEKLSDIVKSL